jgi:hypothetical protein
MRVVQLLGFALVVLWSAAARASGPPVLLGVTDCGELDEHEVRRLVVAELGAIPAEQQEPGVTLVAVRCGGLRVTIRVHDPLSRKDLERSFDAAPLDRRARARWIALAAAELVLSSWAEIELNPNPKVPPAGPESPAPVRRAAAAAVRKRAPVAAASAAPAAPRNQAQRGNLDQVRDPARGQDGEGSLPEDSRGAKPQFVERERELRLFRTVMMGSVRSFFDDKGKLWGGGLRVSEERFSRMSWSADVLLEGGTLANGSRNYEIRSGTVGAWLMVYSRTESAAGLLTGRLGAGIRMGVIASSSGSGGRAANAAAPWGWPLATLSATLGRTFLAELSLEAGYVVLPVGGVESGSNLRGGWVSAQFGIGVSNLRAPRSPPPEER